MQGEGSVLELCHLTRDIDAAVRHWTQDLGAGPFFLFDVPALPGQLHRGQPTEVTMRVAFGFSGGTLIELIQQTNDGPSPFKEFLEQRGEGLHHVLLRVPYDVGYSRLSAAGYELAYSASLPSGERFALFDTTAASGAYTELMDMSDGVLDNLQRIERAHREWDGKTDPVRTMASLYS